MRPLSGFPSGHREIEIKIAITSVAAMKRKLRAAGFGLVVRRIHEWNRLYDFPDARLRRTGCALRLRRAGNVPSVTYKGKRRLTLGMKDREEIETTISDAGAAAMVFERLGLRPTFTYEKYRTTYRRGTLVVVVDETPIGDFVEIEGDPVRILRTARRLGYSDSDFITESYVELYRKRHSGDMLFSVTKADCPRGMARGSRWRDLPESSQESMKGGMQERSGRLGRSEGLGTLSRFTLKAREARRTLSRPAEPQPDRLRLRRFKRGHVR